MILDGIIATLAAGTKIPKIKQGRGVDFLMVKVIRRRVRWLYETWKPSLNASIQCSVFIFGPLVILFYRSFVRRKYQEAKRDDSDVKFLVFG